MTKTEAPVKEAPAAPRETHPQDGAQEGFVGDVVEQEDVRGEKHPYLTLRASDAYGPRGHFLDLTTAQAKDGLAGDNPVLAKPTDEQLARRVV